MAIRTVCILCIVLLTPPFAALAGGDSKPAGIHEYLTRLETFGFAGIIAVAEDGMPVLVESYGLANRETDSPWNPATVSTIGSITKQFTGAAILRLQEQDKLSVQDPITRYFDEVPADKRTITLHQLLTHSSGIVDLEDAGDFDAIGRQEFVRRTLDQELAFSPGDEFDYSNAGYSLLGAIIEQLSGVSYEAFLRRELLIPTGLYETGYRQPLWGDERLAQGYTDEGRWGTVLERPFDQDGPYWVLRANGGIHSTAYDMLRWGQALLAGRALSAESMSTYWAPHVDEGGGTFYAYGWVVDEIGGQRVITHNGGNGIFFADLAMVPQLDLVVFLQTNVRSSLPIVEELLFPILGHLITGEPLPRVPERVELPASELTSATGTYELTGGGELEISLDDGRLLVTSKDPRAFAYLLSTRPVDVQRTERLSARIDSIVNAYLQGDVAPLWEAYDRRVTREYLTETLEDRMRALEADYGAFQRYVVLGTALRPEREITLVRLHFDRGSADRAYVWRKGKEEELLGVSRRGLSSWMRFYPEGTGSFASWEPRTGQSRPMEIREDENGHFRLQLCEDDRRVSAVKR